MGNKLVPRKATEPPSTHGHGARRHRGGVGSADAQGRARGLQPPPGATGVAEEAPWPAEGKALLRRYRAQGMICPSAPTRAEDSRSGREQHPLSRCGGSSVGMGTVGMDGPAAALWLCLAQTQNIPVR